MADLSPDLSPYQALSKQPQGGIGSMDVGSLLGLVQRSRELESQQVVSDALKNTGGDPHSALINILKPGGPGFVNPETVAKLSQLGDYYATQSAKAIGSLYEKSISPGKANANDFESTAAYLAAYHVPPSIISQMRQEVVRSNGSLDSNALLRYRSLGGEPIEMIGAQTSGGVSGQIPSKTAQFAAGQGGGYGMGFVPQDIPGAAVAGGASPTVSAGQYKVAQAQSEEFQNDIQPLLKMHELATSLGSQGLGKSTEIKNDLQNFLIASGGKKVLGADFDENKTYDYEELVKFTRRLADQVSAGGTDARLIQAVGGNPHVGMNQQPFLAVVRYLIAMRRMKQAQYNEYNATHMDPSTGQPNAGAFGPWSSEFLKNQDPRAYAFDLMGEDNASALYKSFGNNSAAKNRFNASKALAEKHGLLESQ